MNENGLPLIKKSLIGRMSLMGKNQNRKVLMKSYASISLRRRLKLDINAHFLWWVIDQIDALLIFLGWGADYFFWNPKKNNEVLAVTKGIFTDRYEKELFLKNNQAIQFSLARQSLNKLDPHLIKLLRIVVKKIGKRTCVVDVILNVTYKSSFAKSFLHSSLQKKFDRLINLLSNLDHPFLKEILAKQSFLLVKGSRFSALLSLGTIDPFEKKYDEDRLKARNWREDLIKKWSAKYYGEMLPKYQGDDQKSNVAWFLARMYTYLTVFPHPYNVSLGALQTAWADMNFLTLSPLEISQAMGYRPQLDGVIFFFFLHFFSNKKVFTPNYLLRCPSCKNILFVISDWRELIDCCLNNYGTAVKKASRCYHCRSSTNKLTVDDIEVVFSYRRSLKIFDRSMFFRSNRWSYRKGLIRTTFADLFCSASFLNAIQHYKNLHPMQEKRETKEVSLLAKSLHFFLLTYEMGNDCEISEVKLYKRLKNVASRFGGRLLHQEQTQSAKVIFPHFLNAEAFFVFFKKSKQHEIFDKNIEFSLLWAIDDTTIICQDDNFSLASPFLQKNLLLMTAMKKNKIYIGEKIWESSNGKSFQKRLQINFLRESGSLKNFTSCKM